MKIIIFHELVDRFSRRPRFPAAPRPNYRRLAIRHRGDSKKSTHPSPTRRRWAAASHSNEHFYKNAETDRGRPARSRRDTASPAPFVSFPLFTRRRGRHPGGGGDRANAKYWPSEKVASYHSHQSKPEFSWARVPATTSVRVVSLRLAVSASHPAAVHFSEPPPGVLPSAPNKWCRRCSRLTRSLAPVLCTTFRALRAHATNISREFEKRSRVLKLLPKCLETTVAWHRTSVAWRESVRCSLRVDWSRCTSRTRAPRPPAWRTFMLISMSTTDRATASWCRPAPRPCSAPCCRDTGGPTSRCQWLSRWWLWTTCRMARWSRSRLEMMRTLWQNWETARRWWRTRSLSSMTWGSWVAAGEASPSRWRSPSARSPAKSPPTWKPSKLPSTVQENPELSKVSFKLL